MLLKNADIETEVVAGVALTPQTLASRPGHLIHNETVWRSAR